MFAKFIALLALASAALAVKIDNGLIGDPVVNCEDTMVSLTFTTEKPFTGRVYVKGLADDDRCSRNFATNTDKSKFSMMVQNGDCAMSRQRVSGTLEGIMFSLTVVVSFHGTFVTKVDRAYRCMCFFKSIKRVTNFIDMSDIGTTPLLDTLAPTTCTYAIKTGSPDGEDLRYGKVGDKIFHVWECDDEAQGFLVHSCWVNDGRGNRFDLMDIDGCAVDPIIQPDVKYDPSLRKAWVETHGYKFSDTSVLNYLCVLELCKKAQGECDGLTPPSCGRGKRSVDTILVKANRPAPIGNQLRDNEMDVVANMDILDNMEAEDLDKPRLTDDFLRTLNGQTLLTGRAGMISKYENQTCLSSPSFGLLIAITIILLITAVTSSAMLCARSRSVEKS